MSFELLVQFLVLGATAVLFWYARRDLRSRPAAAASVPNAGGMEELEQLCATLETVVTDLSHRLSALEYSSREHSTQEYSSREYAAPKHSGEEPRVAARPQPESLAASVPNAQYAPVYALMDAGVTDAHEVARRTGLSLGEVDLILGLRARQIL